MRTVGQVSVGGPPKMEGIMPVVNRIARLSSKLEQAGFDGQLVVVEGNLDGWEGIWPSFCAAFESFKSGQSVVLVIEQEIEDGLEAVTRNQLREELRVSARRNRILTYSSVESASAEALAALGLQEP